MGSWHRTSSTLPWSTAPLPLTTWRGCFIRVYCVCAWTCACVFACSERGLKKQCCRLKHARPPLLRILVPCCRLCCLLNHGCSALKSVLIRSSVLTQLTITGIPFTPRALTLLSQVRCFCFACFEDCTQRHRHKHTDTSTQTQTQSHNFVHGRVDHMQGIAESALVALSISDAQVNDQGCASEWVDA